MEEYHDPELDAKMAEFCRGLESDVATTDDIDRIGRTAMAIVPRFPVKEQFGFGTRVNDGRITMISDRFVDADGNTSLTATVTFHSEDLSLQPEEVDEFNEEKPYFTLHFDSSNNKPVRADKTLRKLEGDVAKKVIEQATHAREIIEHDYTRALFGHFINLGNFALDGSGIFEPSFIEVNGEVMLFEDAVRVAATGFIPIMRSVRETTILVNDDIKLDVTTIDYDSVFDGVDMPDIEGDPHVIIAERMAVNGSLILKLRQFHNGHAEAKLTEDDDDYELDPDELDDYSSDLDFGVLSKTDANRLIGYLETAFEKDLSRAVEGLDDEETRQVFNDNENDDN